MPCTSPVQGRRFVYRTCSRNRVGCSRRLNRVSLNFNENANVPFSEILTVLL